METGRPTVPPLLRMFDTMLRDVKARAGIPNQPGEDPGVSVTFTLEIQIVGKDSLGQKRKVEITFDVVTIGWYDIYEDTEIESLYREFVEKIGPELTHNSDKWACLECGLPATDIAWVSVYTVVEYFYKRCTILIRTGCETCAAKMQRATPKILVTEIHNRRQGAGDSKSPTAIGTIPRPDALGGGLSGGCLTCCKELQSTAASASSMSRCGKCKLVRYSTYASDRTQFHLRFTASVACQKQDWARHKTICRTIQNVSRSESKEEERVTAVEDHETGSEECEISAKDLETASKLTPVDLEERETPSRKRGTSSSKKPTCIMM
ncbi:MYND-type domain-containing protein [Mycena venus]|uniref:MYND-type domain-containing protein n=1 Tax=Mycena venus TaxID=2733690 RepID=A0A8H6XQT6_9AGAR|nr:MYND-type domain-containing protein [Mycena venus]